MVEYIYLLQEREFIKTKENIYKVGKTTQPNLCRIKNYPSGSVLLFQLYCTDCNALELKILKFFRQKYIVRKDIGSEYFEGDCDDMIADMY